ncbi:MAG: T9SS type A sorting domain-containing protein [Flavobacteriales bacterium]|nr:MAG: T9SS type A sorting domain-containing protein [Flavobacteriales bacterium]
MFRKLLFALSLLSCVLAQAQLGDLIRPRGIVANAGQVKKADGKVADELLYRWQGPDFSIAFMADRFVYEISYVHKDTLAAYRAAKPEEGRELRGGHHRIEYIYPAGTAARLLAEGGTKSKISYPDHKGGPQIVPMVYDKLVYKNAFPGADVVFTITADGQCKYDVVVSKGAKLADVRFDVTGLDAASTKMDGNQLTCELPFGRFVERVPEAYAEKSGGREKVSAAYAGSHRSVGYSVQEDAGDHAVVIDPIGLIEWGTWFCTPNNSIAWAVVATEDGFMYATGDCQWDNIMHDTFTNYDWDSNTYTYDIWVARFKDVDNIGVLDIDDLDWCNIQGGIKNELAQDLDVCGNTVAVVGGTFSSTGIDFLGGSSYNGGALSLAEDGFLMYFDAPSGGRTMGMYIGGLDDDRAHTVEFDCRPLAVPYCYVAGSGSNGNVYPSLPLGALGGFQDIPLCAGQDLAFLERHSPTGTVEMRTFYTGACGTTVLVKDLDVDQDGNPILLTAAYDNINPADLGINFGTQQFGGSDLVLSSFAYDGTLNWARFCGTPFWDGLTFGNWEYSNDASVVVGPNNQIYLGWYAYPNGTIDMQGYMTRIANDANNPAEVWNPQLQMPSSTNTCHSTVKGMSVTCSGTIMVIGDTDCQNAAFAGGHQPTPGGSLDGFLVEVEDTGTGGVIIDQTYYGGLYDDWISGVAAQEPGKVYICGVSQSPIQLGGIAYNASGANPNWLQGGGIDNKAFLAKFPLECPDPCALTPATITITDETYASSLGVTGYTNQTIRIEGDWYIDMGFDLINCTVHAMTGSQIIVVNTSSYLYLENTHISACEDMWKGIHLMNYQTGIRMFDSSISDAQYAIWMEFGSYAHAERSEFFNNYDGIYIKEPCAGCFNLVTLELSGCSFRTIGAGLKTPYPGQTPTPGSIGYAGIDAHTTYLSIVSPGLNGDNVFRNLNHGIVTADVTLSVSEARFEDIKPDPAYGSNLYQGSAIYSTGYGGYCGLDLQGRGTAANDPVTFLNCRTGIWTERMDLRAQLSKIEGPMAVTGVTARYSGGLSVDISENTMDVQGTAIDLRFNDGASSLSVHNNDLTFGIAFPSTNGLLPGVWVAEMNGNNPASEIRNNMLRTRQDAAVWRALWLNSASGYVVNENYIELTTESANRTGIELRGCTNTRLTCNNVQGPSSWTSSHTSQAGIRHSMGDNNYLACNNVNWTRHGVLFNGWSPATDLRGNNFGNHEIGLELTQNSLIGGQDHKGNMWNVQSALWDARWVNPNSLAGNEISVNGSNPLCVPNNVSPFAGWFVPTGLPNDECSTFMPQCPSVNFQGGGSQRSAQMDEAVMLGSIQNGIYTDETRLTLAYELYLALLKDPALYSGGPYTADFVTLMENSVADGLKDVEQPRKELYEVPGPVLASVQQNEVAIEALMLQVKTAMEQLAMGGLSPAQEAALLASIASWQQNIESLDTYNTTAMANLDAARTVEAMLLESGASALTSTELIEQNAKMVNEIYLNTIAVTGEGLVFDAAQEAALFSIASQCPLLGGNPVYQARSMYTLIDEEMDFDDALICVAAGFAVKDVEASAPRVSVYPNPNRDGVLNFHMTGLDETNETNAMVSLYDAQGQEVASQEGIKTSRSQMDVSRLAQGVYQWVVRLNGSRLAQGKVTIF